VSPWETDAEFCASPTCFGGRKSLAHETRVSAVRICFAAAAPLGAGERGEPCN